MAGRSAPTRYDIGFLHTADVHTETFTRLASERGFSSSHVVRAGWLAEAVQHGVSAELTERVSRQLLELQAECAVVVCTCSTLGAIATELRQPTIFRVDQPMMAMAASHNGVPLLAFCLESTRQSSTELLTDALKAAGKPPTIALADCSAAWPSFTDGDLGQFGHQIAGVVTAEYRNGNNVGCIVLAQASMAAALPYLSHHGPVYCSPETAIEHAANLLTAR